MCLRGLLRGKRGGERERRFWSDDYHCVYSSNLFSLRSIRGKEKKKEKEEEENGTKQASTIMSFDKEPVYLIKSIRAI